MTHLKIKTRNTMKKIITICFMMVAITFSMQAQKKATAQKATTTVTAAETSPTKEETIAWLTEKMKLYLECYRFDSALNSTIKTNFELRINECEVILNVPQENGKQYTRHFPLIGMEFMGEKSKTFKSEVDGEIVYVGMFEYSYNSIYSESSDIRDYSSDQIWIKGYDEPNLIPRMRKAFAHLATFCQEKKEKF